MHVHCSNRPPIIVSVQTKEKFVFSLYAWTLNQSVEITLTPLPAKQNQLRKCGGKATEDNWRIERIETHSGLVGGGGEMRQRNASPRKVSLIFRPKRHEGKKLAQSDCLLFQFSASSASLLFMILGTLFWEVGDKALEPWQRVRVRVTRNEMKRKITKLSLQKREKWCEKLAAACRRKEKKESSQTLPLCVKCVCVWVWGVLFDTRESNFHACHRTRMTGMRKMGPARVWWEGYGVGG